MNWTEPNFCIVHQPTNDMKWAKIPMFVLVLKYDIYTYTCYLCIENNTQNIHWNNENLYASISWRCYLSHPINSLTVILNGDMLLNLITITIATNLSNNNTHVKWTASVVCKAQWQCYGFDLTGYSFWNHISNWIWCNISVKCE